MRNGEQALVLILLRKWPKLHLEVRLMINSNPSSVLSEGHTAFLVQHKDTEEWTKDSQQIEPSSALLILCPNCWEERPSL